MIATPAQTAAAAAPPAQAGAAGQSSAFRRLSGAAWSAAREERGMILAAATQVAVREWFAKSVGPSESGPDEDGVRAALAAR